MTEPEKPPSAEELYHTALERAPGERAAFLDQACRGDAALRREVESLLGYADEAKRLLDEPVAGAATQALGMTPGTRLGPYEVVEPIGAGGMGEVFRARDTKLGRDVALKRLPDALSQDRERLSRFEREARVLASLNHPGIATLYGLEEHEGRPLLVMELVEGETLGARLERGPLQREEALDVFAQMAEALEAAHERGIVHRDLKPANVQLTPAGRVKLLDFGLAKTLAGESGSPDASRTATQEGMVLGTAAYMSPEQARGQELDARTDLWSFGCVLYEALSGRRSFRAATVTETLAAVLQGEVEWEALPAWTPEALRRLLRRCLEREPSRRLRHAADARLEIEDARAELEAARAGTAAGKGLDEMASGPVSIRQRLLPWAIAGAALLALGLTLAFRVPGPSSSSSRPARLDVRLGTERGLRPAAMYRGPAAVLSPDGTTLAFVSIPGGIHLRPLDRLESQPLAGTQQAVGPFFSPDGQWIGFFAQDQLWKIPLSGGPAVALAEAPNPRGGSWGEDGSIVFVPESAVGEGLRRVSSSGGEVETLTTPDPDAGEAVHQWPQALPDGRVLYTAHAGTGSFDDASLVMEAFPDGPRRVVYRGGYHGRYLPSGHLVFVRQGTLFAAPFDPVAMEPTGPPVPVLEEVRTTAHLGTAQFSFSSEGTLVYVPPPALSGAPIHWLTRDGAATLLRSEPAHWAVPAFSPDGDRLAMTINLATTSDIWVYEWSRDTLIRVTFDPGLDDSPVWSPDGRSLVFHSSRDVTGVFNLYWRSADGAGEVHRLTTSENTQVPMSWHPSGRYLAFSERGRVKTLEMRWDEAAGWVPGAIEDRFAGGRATFSPDGRFLAYSSTESGRYEVYVRSFPSLDGKVQVSANGGANPRWSRVRSELLFASLDLELMVAPYESEGASLRVGRPALWSDVRVQPTGFDLHPDGERMAVRLTYDESIYRPEHVVLAFDFFEELRRRTASGE